MAYRKWASHADTLDSIVECCTEATPCAFHCRFPDAIRSPDIGQDMERAACPECVAGDSGIVTATS